jgi:flagellar biosynthesis protein FlhB
MADEAAEKKHNATSYRRQKAREQGHFARSDELTSAAIFLTSILCLQYFAPKLYSMLHNLFLSQFTYRADSMMEDAIILDETVAGVGLGFWTVLPLLVISLIVAAVAHLAQSRFAIAPPKMNFDWERINPAIGFQRLFSMDNVSKSGFGFIRVILITCVLISATYFKWNQVAVVGELSLAQSAALTWKIIIDVLVNAAIVLLVMGIADYGFQLWKFEQQIRMTDDELREELKSTQGDLSAKGRRQQIQSEFRRKTQSDFLPNCDFLIIDRSTNYAIAIAYDPDAWSSPRIVAKGTKIVAQRMHGEAGPQTVPVHVSDKLAKRMFEQYTEGESLTSEYFSDIARIFQSLHESDSPKNNLTTTSRVPQQIAT